MVETWSRKPYTSFAQTTGVFKNRIFDEKVPWIKDDPKPRKAKSVTERLELQKIRPSTEVHNVIIGVNNYGKAFCYDLEREQNLTKSSTESVALIFWSWGGNYWADIVHVAKSNLGKVNLKSMRPAVFLTNMCAGVCLAMCWRISLICHLLLCCYHSCLFYIVSLANLLPCPSHPCWKSEPGKYCVR